MTTIGAAEREAWRKRFDARWDSAAGYVRWQMLDENWLVWVQAKDGRVFGACVQARFLGRDMVWDPISENLKCPEHLKGLPWWPATEFT